MATKTRLDADVTLTPDEVQQALQRPSDFGYFGGDPAMFDTWSLGPVIRHRDSGLLDQSNAEALEAHLKSDASLDADWRISGCSHWAVGWVDHLSFRVVEDDRATPTRIARVLKAWFDALDDYPVADEDDYSKREYEALLENFERALDWSNLTLNAKGQEIDWVSAFMDWAGETGHECCIENIDDQGAYPCDGHLEEGLRTLGLLVEEGA